MAQTCQWLFLVQRTERAPWNWAKRPFPLLICQNGRPQGPSPAPSSKEDEGCLDRQASRAGRQCCGRGMGNSALTHRDPHPKAEPCLGPGVRRAL